MASTELGIPKNQFPLLGVPGKAGGVLAYGFRNPTESLDERETYSLRHIGQHSIERD